MILMLKEDLKLMKEEKDENNIFKKKKQQMCIDRILFCLDSSAVLLGMVVVSERQHPLPFY